MSISQSFIHRPIATTLLTLAIALAGSLAFYLLPVSPLPQTDSPTISVNAGLPGASPEIVASSIATPLERQFGRIAGVTQMTSQSSLGSANVTLQFDLSRDQRRAQQPAGQSAGQPHLPEGEPGRLARDDRRADLAHRHQGTDV
jgi:multidrug efflux pump